MTTNKTYKSDILAAIHETVSGYYEAGVISEQTMREFDESCLTEVHDFTAEEIIALREREQVSQTALAYYLNVSKELVSEWERGVEHPDGAALKLLSLAVRKGLVALV